MPDPEEKEIIDKIKAGEINHFSYLVKKYSRKALLFARQRVKSKDDAEDIVQNSFIKIYKSLDRFDSSRSLYPYLLSVVKNEINQYFRDNPRYLPITEDFEGVQEIEDTSDFNQMPLKEEHKTVLNLLIEGYSYQEIADKMERPLNTVRTLIRRAKIEVRRNYEG